MRTTVNVRNCTAPAATRGARGNWPMLDKVSPFVCCLLVTQHIGLPVSIEFVLISSTTFASLLQFVYLWAFHTDHIYMYVAPKYL